WAPTISGSGFDLVARAGVATGQSGGVAGGGPPASLAGETYLRFNPKSLVLADNGRFAFQATLAPSALTTDANDTVIIERRADGALSVAAREGDLVAALGATIKSLDTSAYDTFGGLSINSAGDLAFASIDPADPPTTGVSRLWRRTSTGALQLIAARNASSGAGAPSGLAGVFSTILAPALSSSGAVVFAGTVTLSAGGQVSGLWIVPTGAAPQLIAQSGVATGPLAPPGNTGVVFAVDPPLRGTYRINSRDQVAFRWKLEDGVGGATTANDDALWVWDPTQGILGVVRTGDSISIAGAAPAVRSINMFLGPAGNDDGRLMDLNSRGELACCVQFTDSTGALLVSQLPGIGACCRGATCSQSASSACSGPATRFAGIGVACSPVSAGGCCKADFDQSGTLNSYDLFDFLGAWFAQDPAADIDGSGQVTTVDVLQFLGAWYNGC
ncbi:MAG TPA: choice-of-anchor tandem repeat NxxGxxAF-containing protein, partial [Phycisphaerales bacterium]|nr:choice-of-anchor tandem repeat NxxGxxAF-containing protein [Phycisphaerales bacterium]